MYMVNCRHCKKQLDGQQVLALRKSADLIAQQIAAAEAKASASSADGSKPQTDAPNLEPARAEAKAIQAKIDDLTICEDCRHEEEKHAEQAGLLKALNAELKNLSGGYGAMLDELQKITAAVERTNALLSKKGARE